jgi:hypothetical protein
MVSFLAILLILKTKVNEEPEFEMTYDLYLSLTGKGRVFKLFF